MIENWDQFVICVRKKSEHLPDLYKQRIDFELNEANKQGLNGLWLEYFNEDKKFGDNPNNLILPWVLGMVNSALDPMISRESPLLLSTDVDRIAVYSDEHGHIPHDFSKDSDVPDIDIDCLPAARDPIKEYAIRRYGQGENLSSLQVCSVGTWQTYKFKMAIQDAATALGVLYRNEVQKVTSILPDDVDNLKSGGLAGCKGKIVNERGESKECGTKHMKLQCPNCGSEETDAPTLMKLLQDHEPLKDFCQQYPLVIARAIKMVGRIRNMGMHAGALIISNEPLLGKVPMARRTASSQWVTMYSEGSNQQLSKCGYIKWDILGLKTLQYIYATCMLIKKNRNIKFGIPQEIEGYGGLYELSGLDEIDPEAGYCGKFYDTEDVEHEIRYDDKETYRLINEQRTDTIFQFDTSLAKSILGNASVGNGITTPDMLALINAMGHPGPMQSIPDVIANRDDSSGSWERALKTESEILYSVLKDTYGVICYHEDTMISLGDGSHCKISDLSKMVDENPVSVHSVNLNTRSVNTNLAVCCKPTVFGKGIKITLESGHCLVVTPSHKVHTWNGYAEAQHLSIDDLVSVPVELKPIAVSNQFSELCEWLGSPESCAYLVGQLLGDGCLTGTSFAISAGHLRNCDLLESWIDDNLELKVNKYFHCRSWYLGLSNSSKTGVSIDLCDFEDTSDWWNNAYSKYSGSDIAVFIGRSTWFVYDRINKFCGEANGLRKRSWKTKWHDFVETLGLNTNLHNKKIPNCLFKASKREKAALLAGLIDSDGCICSKDTRSDIVHITSESPLLIDDIRHLLSTLNITFKVYSNRIFIWSTTVFCDLIEEFLVLKEFGNLSDGKSVGWVPKDAFVAFVDDSFESKRSFQRKTGVSRKVFGHDCDFVKTSTAIKAGMDLGDLIHYRIVDLEIVDNQQFFDLTVENDHNLIANGILASNCYQEQLTAIWQRLGGFSSTEAQLARKDIAKKRVHKMKKIEQKWMVGASKTLGKESASKWWEKMVTFGRYAFNRCISGQTLLKCQKTNDIKTCFEWFQSNQKPFLNSYKNNDVLVDECLDIHYSGDQEVFKIEFDNGQFEYVTMQHKFLCQDGEYHEVQEIVDKGLDVVDIGSFTNSD